MKSSLLDIYKKENQNGCVYYDNKNDLIHSRKNYLDIFIREPSESIACDFIFDYFNRGGKTSLFNGKLEKEFRKSGKNIHTLSLYLLGCFFKKEFKSILKNEIQNKFACEDIFAESKYDFTYTWFLSCLSHDFTFNIEKAQNQVNLENFDDMIKKIEINHLFYDDEIMSQHTTYSKELYKSYYNKMAKEKNHIDHGIIMGLMLYDRLTKNHKKKFNELILHDNTQNYSIDCFKIDNLIFSKGLLSHLAYVSDSVAAHNIWHEYYKEKDLAEVSKNNHFEKKLNIEDNSLSFFLSLMDSIEPIKYFLNHNPRSIMENIFLEKKFSGDKIKIIISQKYSKHFDMEEWYKNKFENLSDWLNIEKAIYNKVEEAIIIIIPTVNS